MKLSKIFTQAFWKARWQDTIDGFAAHGRALGGQPPWDTTQPQPPAEQPKPAPETKKQQQPGAPG